MFFTRFLFDAYTYTYTYAPGGWRIIQFLEQTNGRSTRGHCRDQRFSQWHSNDSKKRDLEAMTTLGIQIAVKMIGRGVRTLAIS